jgi:NAD+ synthase (glutamine-hydrolysing)
LKIYLVQFNPLVGAIEGNTKQIIESLRNKNKEDLLVYPELAISGYPPEDLLFHAGIKKRIADAHQAIAQATLNGPSILVGTPLYKGDAIYNAALYFSNGKIQGTYEKQELPNYSVFDEKRYFISGNQPLTITLSGIKFGILICEDLWSEEVFQRATKNKNDCLIVINGSPFELEKHLKRQGLLKDRAIKSTIPIIYLNLVGGQDELIFDGASFVVNEQGKPVCQAELFKEETIILECAKDQSGKLIIEGKLAVLPGRVEAIYSGLVKGVSDYAKKNGFSKIILGLSGGIDSALTLAVAVDSLGSDNVEAVMMPSEFTSEMSLEDAKEQASILNVEYSQIDITKIRSIFDEALETEFLGYQKDVTEENIQSRIRCILLMAISNKKNALLLTTGNKSEMAVGYSTLYGDMAGGFAPLKDCTKTLVYELSHYRNSIGNVIPSRVIDRAPSAELAPNQKDTDSLPDYPVLDSILNLLIENDLSLEQIQDRGFDREMVIKVLNLVKRNEYKRRQSPPGIRITPRAFGKDWRYPITSGY